MLEVEFEEGEPLRVPTDGRWRTTDNAAPRWEQPGFDDSGWIEPQIAGAAGTAPWGQPAGPDHRRLPARMLRREFRVNGNLRRATAYVCGLGFFDLHLNGRPIGDSLMNPALTGYDRRACYVTFDLTPDVHPGANAIGVVLGNGRYFAPRRDPGPDADLRLPQAAPPAPPGVRDGTVENVTTDNEWRITDDGPIRSNNEYDGEEYDARREMPGWSLPGFDDSRWPRAALVEAAGRGDRSPDARADPRRRGPQAGRPVQSPAGHLPGRLRPVLLRHGATQGLRPRWDRGPNAHVVQRDARRPAQRRQRPQRLNTDIYTLKGQGVETWSPRFKGNATRYVQIEGFPGTPTADNFEGLVTHTDMEPVGGLPARTP